MTHEFFGLAGVVPTAKAALHEAVEGLKQAFTQHVEAPLTR